MSKRSLTVEQFAAMGGKARAKSLSAERRKEIARQAIAARWGSAVRVKTKAGKERAADYLRSLEGMKPATEESSMTEEETIQALVPAVEWVQAAQADLEQAT